MEKQQLRKAAIASLSLTLFTSSALQAGQIWDGGGANNNWNTAANWDGSGGGVLPTFSSPITFQGNTRNGAVNNLTADTTIGGINLTNDGTSGKTNAFTLSGARITLGGNITTTANTAGSTITNTISLDLILSNHRIITTNQLSDTVQHNLIISGNISETGGARDLAKNGGGLLTLTGANSYSRSTIVNAGILDLGGGTANGSLSSANLNLFGGSFRYTRTGTNTQSFTTTNINTASATSITGAAGNTLNLGTVTRGAGATLNFATTGLGIIAASTTSHDATGIMAGFTVGDSWAVANGAGVAISGLSNGSYTQSSSALDAAGSYTGFNIDVDSSQTPDAAITANSLRFSSAAANILTLQGTNTVTSGGILVGSGVGSNLSTITGGTLVGAASKDLSIIQNNSSGGLTISSIIANNGGATALTKSGAGLLTLDNSNTFTGGVFIHGGSITLANAGALNSTTGLENAVTFGSGSIGTLTLNGNSVVLRSLATNATTPGTAVVQNASANNITLTIGNSANASGAFGGIIQDGAGGGKLALSKLGSGTLTLSGANTYTGGTTLNGGTIVITNSTSFGADDVLVTGASRIDAAFSNTYANSIDVGATLSLKAGLYTAADSSPGGTVTYSGILSGAGDINILNSNTGNNQTEIFFSNANNTFTGSVISAEGNANGADYFRFNSIGDGGTFTLNKGGNRGGVIYSGSSAIEFDVRQIVLGTTLSTGNGTIGGYTATLSGLNGNGIPVNSFANNASDAAHTVTFTQDMAMTSVANNTFFYFDGSNTGNNRFAGDIGDPTGAQTLGIGKWGTGKWILSGNNSFEGDLLVANGTLAATTIDNALTNQSIGRGFFIILGHSGTSGTLEYIGTADASTNKQVVLGNIRNNNQTGAGGIVNNSTTGKLTFTNATFNSIEGSTLTTRARTLTLGGSNTGANEIQGVIQNNATGALVDLIKTGTGTWVLSNTASTYTGATTINAGVLNVAALAAGGSNSSIGAATVTNTNLVLNGGTLRYSGSAATSTNRIFSVGSNGATFDASGTGSGTMSFTGTTQIGYNSETTARSITLTGTNTGNNTMAVIIGNNTGATSLTKSGAGNWVLSGTNTYTGGTSISGGTLDVANVRGLGASGTLSINAASTTRLSTDTAFGTGGNPVYNVQMQGVASIGGGYTSTIQLNRATSGATTGITHNFGSMTISLNGGGAATLNVTAGANAPTGGAIDTIAFTSMSAGNNNTVTETLNPTGGNITVGSLTAFGNQMVTMNLSGTTAGNAITGVIGGTGNQNLVAITKSSSSTWTLSGANTYNGGTDVTGGTLLVNNTTGSGTGSGDVIVSSGGTLGGDGTISGAVTVSGKIAPGTTGTGELKTGAVTWNSGQAWQFDLSSSDNTSDLLAITGAFTKGSGSGFLFDFMGSTPKWGETYTLVTFASTDFISGDFDLVGSIATLGSGSYSTSEFSITSGSLQFTAIPEPTTALGGLLITAGLLRRRRKVEG